MNTFFCTVVGQKKMHTKTHTEIVCDEYAILNEIHGEKKYPLKIGQTIQNQNKWPNTTTKTVM